jgi:mannose-6-phosphate isomerase-like protein (cupin superfamily)
LPDARLQAWRAGWPAAPTGRAVAPAALPVLQWLPPPGDLGFAPARGVLARLHAARDILAWRQSYTAADFGPEFLQNYGWTELLGQRGPLASETLACGFLLLGPAVEYPSHHHQAEEIYIVLSGTAAWRRAAAPWADQPPGAVIHHAANMPHAMRTAAEPLVALYLWRGGELTQKSVIG